MSSQPNAASPLANAEFLVMEFDHTNAHLNVVNNVAYAAGEVSRADAVRTAEEAAREAATKGLSRTYVVVRLATEAVYTANRT